MRNVIPVAVILGALCAAFSSVALADVINVPADQSTIQAAINDANDGDEVVVTAGTYTESINFLGKAITVRSASGNPANTIIDAGDNTAVPAEINTDRDGHERFFDDLDQADTGNPIGTPPIVDMGAYEVIVFSIVDLALFAECMNGPDYPPSPTLPATSQECLDAFDFDNDGDVDLEDAGTVQASYQGPDCATTCGDGICECDENEDNCCEDCGCPSCESCVGGTCQSDCGDGFCDPACENSATCAEDCAAPCGTSGQACPCCPGFECFSIGVCLANPCRELGDQCLRGIADCCSGLACVDNPNGSWGLCVD